MTDWETIEREYRAGQLSVSEIGRQNGVSHTAINKRAKREGWTRNLAARVKEEVSARLVSEGVSSASARETVEAAAERVVQVVRQHRADIKSGRDIVGSLMAELREGTDNRCEIEETIEEETASDRNPKRRAAMLKAVSLPSRAGVMFSLSSAMKNLIALERQAFNVDGKVAGDAEENPVAALMEAIAGNGRPRPGS